MKTNVDWYHQVKHKHCYTCFYQPSGQVRLVKESFKFKSKSPDSVTRLNAWEEIPLSIAGMPEIAQWWPALSRDTRPGPGILTTKADFYCSRAWNYSTVNLQAGTPFNSKLLALIYDKSWSRKERMFSRYNYHYTALGEENVIRPSLITKKWLIQYWAEIVNGEPIWWASTSEDEKNFLLKIFSVRGNHDITSWNKMRCWKLHRSTFWHLEKVTIIEIIEVW